MKVNKLFCIEVDLVEKLNKIDNQSKLISDLLSDFFAISSENHNIIDQKKALIKQNKQKMSKIKKDIKVLSYLEDQNFDQKCINWVHNKEFIYNDHDIDMYISNRRIKIKIDQFKKCCDMVKEYGYLFKKTG